MRWLRVIGGSISRPIRWYLTTTTPKITDRLGPYKTREEAERALERVEERNEEYDNDPRWNDDL